MFSCVALIQSGCYDEKSGTNLAVNASYLIQQDSADFEDFGTSHRLKEMYGVNITHK